MNFNDYQSKALESVAITDKTAVALAHRTLGLSGEAGIIANAMKKVVRDKNGQLSADDIALLKDKIGDVLYYAAVLAEYADIKLEDVAAANLEKSANFKKSRS